MSNRAHVRRLPRADPNARPRALPRPHRIIIEQGGEAPGVMGIYCSCGERTWTPWGEAHAEEIANIHLWAVGAPNARRVVVFR